MDETELVTNEATWTVCDDDGVDHRALRQESGVFTFVITACPWWKTHNVSGQKAPVRVDRTPTCIECTLLDIARLGASCKT